MIEILYKDRHIAVCVKPVGTISEDAGMPSLLRQQLGGEAYCVHRLDTVVGGVMVYALTKKAASALSAYIAGDMLTKEYLAVVEGIPAPDEGYWDDLLLKDSAKGKSYVVQRMRKGVREASLAYRTLDRTEELSLVRVQLHTGRTHQIRVQFSSRQLPLLGDIRYGSKDPRCTAALWSYRLAFTHPVTGKALDITMPPPDQYPWNLFRAGELA